MQVYHRGHGEGTEEDWTVLLIMPHRADHYPDFPDVVCRKQKDNRTLAARGKRGQTLSGPNLPKLGVSKMLFQGLMWTLTSHFIPRNEQLQNRGTHFLSCFEKSDCRGFQP